MEEPTPWDKASARGYEAFVRYKRFIGLFWLTNPTEEEEHVCVLSGGQARISRSYGIESFLALAFSIQHSVSRSSSK